MTTMPATIEILNYMRSVVDQYVVGQIVNDVELAMDAMEHFGCLTVGLAERDVFASIAYKVGTEKEKELNEN